MTTKYTPDHEWINIEDHEAAVVGITHHAQDALGDVVFVDLPEVGRSFKKGEVAGPLGNGWFFKVHVTDMAEFDQLMDPPAYDALLKTL
jgi:glycine cleavage system H protein